MSRFNNRTHQDMAQIDEDPNRQEIRRRRDGERKKREVGGKWSRKTKYRWLDADWMAMGYAGHAVAMEKRLAAEWMAIIFFSGYVFPRVWRWRRRAVRFCMSKFSHTELLDTEYSGNEDYGRKGSALIIRKCWTFFKITRSQV
jgi:hypothetical protein